MNRVSHTPFMNIFEKINFVLKKPKVIIVIGEGRLSTREAIFQVLKQYPRVGKKVLVFETDLKDSGNLEKCKFLVKNSSLPILVASHIGSPPPDKYSFAGDKEKTIKIRELVKKLPPFGYLVLNFDDETVREIKTEANLKEITRAPEGYKPSVRGSALRSFTFGFQEEAEFRASDIHLNGGTNFKLNYKGNVVPIWLEKLFGKEQIYSALAATAVGTILGLNLVEMSQAFKNYPQK